MSWKVILKGDYEAANEALDMDSAHDELDTALRYEVQDIRFADFANKEKFLSKMKENSFAIGKHSFTFDSKSGDDVMFKVQGAYGGPFAVTFDISGDEVKYTIDAHEDYYKKSD